MAVPDRDNQHQQSQSFFLDALYCEEEDHQWEDEEEVEREALPPVHNNSNKIKVEQEDMFWEDEELLSLFSREKQQERAHWARTEAVDWMLKVGAHFGFTALTSILSINYLDRFLSSKNTHQIIKDGNKPSWMIQFVAVTCLSLAAKVEETHVPLLVDLQVEDTKYVFEAKTIQRMELLVMSTLEWRMTPVTPLSFLDHIIRRLGLETHQIHWDFYRQCESLLLTLVADSRFVRYLPSVLATATMLHVIHQLEPRDPIDYQNRLLGVLNTTKEKVSDCYQRIVELSNSKSNTSGCFYGQKNPPLHHKRKYEGQDVPSSPSRVIDAASLSFSSDDGSNDSWVVDSSVPTDHHPPLKKNKKTTTDQFKIEPLMMASLSRSSSSRVFVDVVCRPR
ncbi:hypothetical protein RJ639_007004 [Escallonia herrerae]|uniref:Cyclin D3 n=1 Tax=Escallonia herrerae TaxID=1293975 RepID=A0AA88VZV4_9ASTE|nr:hypothetical protein RJ639_007004 [Escallonia herrerae]